MTSQVESALKALKAGRSLEKQGLTFYRDAAQKTKSTKGREVFESLQRDEAMHLRLIQRQIDALSEQGKWVELPEASGASVDLSTEVFPKGREGLEKAVKGDTDDAEALILAMEFETKSYDMYRQDAKAAEVPEARAMYEFLASQERTHFDLLMANWEAMVQRGGWAE